MSRLIYTSDSPNSRSKDIIASVKLLFAPWSWNDGKSVEQIESYFSKYYPGADLYAFNYARSALYFLLSRLEHDQDDQIVYQSFTCAAASLPAIWAGYKPIYVDIDENTLSPNVAAIENAINQKTKAIVVQYTMGLGPDLDAIRSVADKHGVLLIEDCTHFMPSEGSHYIGSKGDYAIFSFGRDKVLSAVDGGVLLSRDRQLNERLSGDYQRLKYPGLFWTFQRLLYTPLWALIRATYSVKLGKAIHLLASETNLLTRATSKEEKAGKRPSYIPSLLPNSLGKLASIQISDVNTLQAHRNDIAKIYRSRLQGVKGIKFFNPHTYSPLRFPLMLENRDHVKAEMKSRNILIGDWYMKPVAPVEIPANISKYVEGSCPVAQEISDRILNLPTHTNVTKQDARIICDNLIEICEK